MQPESRLIVTEYRPGRVRTIALWACLTLIVVFVGGYLSGSRYYSKAMHESRVNAGALEKSNREVAGLQQNLTNLRVALQVDMATLEQVRREMTQLQARLVEQENELSRYRTLLRDSGVKGLHIDSFTVRATQAPGRFNYSLVIRQKEALIKALDVAIEVVIEGRLSGAHAAFPLEKLDPKLDAGPIQTRFKYFKVLEGSMNLPVGFEPDRVLVTVAPEDKERQPVEATFEWQQPEV